MHPPIGFHRAASVAFLACAIFLMAAAHPVPKVIDTPHGAWNTDLTSGLLAVLKPGVPAMVMVSANWCPDCKLMKQAVFTDAGVQAALKDWNTVYVDWDTYPQPRDALKVIAIPTIIALDSRGEELSRVQDDMTAGQFAAWAKDMRARSDRLAELDARLAKTPRDPKLLDDKSGELAALGLFMSKVDPRVMIANAARLGAAIECAGQAGAAGRRTPSDSVEFLEMAREAVGGNTRDAAAKLAAFAKKNSRADDVLFWQGAIARIDQLNAARQAKAAKTTPPPVDYPKLAGAFQAYLDKYPSGRYADPARRTIETLKREQASAQKAAAKAAKAKATPPAANAK